MGKYLFYGVMGKNITYYPHVYVNFKSAPSVLIFLIRVIRVVKCKVCKDSSVRGMFIPLWCIILDGRVRVYAQKKKKSKKHEKKRKK